MPSYNFGGFTGDPELEALRQRMAYAEMLRQQGGDQPQGQMVSGHYVAPSWTQQAANMLRSYMGAKAQRDAQEQYTDIMSGLRARIADALRTGDFSAVADIAPELAAENARDVRNYQQQIKRDSQQWEAQYARAQEQDERRALEREQDAAIRRQERKEDADTRAAERAQDRAYNASNEPLEKVLGPDGKPTLVQRSKAAGMTPFDPVRQEKLVPVVGPDGRATLVPQSQAEGMTPYSAQAAALDKKAAAAAAKDEKARKLHIGQAKNVLAMIDKAAENVSGWTAGYGGLLAGVPRTDSLTLAGDLRTIKANIGFDKLQEMRDASPTGGALGQVAVQELEALQSSIASLDQLRDPDELRKSLGSVRQHYQNWLNTIAGDAQEPAGGDYDEADRIVGFGK